MQHPRSIWDIMRFSMLAFASFIAGQGYVFAQGEDSASTGAGAWVMAYMLVILVLALGLMVVCKSSRRRDTAKPEVYEQPKKTLLQD